MSLAKLKTMFFGEEEGYYDDEYDMYDDEDEYDARQPEQVRSKRHDNVISMPSSITAQKERMVISRPKTVDDVPAITDCLRMNMICVVNLEGVDISNAQRIADFISGAGYALNCEIERVSNDIFIVAPTHVSVTNDFKEEVKNSHILPWISAFK
jgi:cell division inhibitor SepF